MSNLDSTLQEVHCNSFVFFEILCKVSEVSQGTYKLKPRFLLNLDVDQWPFYTDAQKAMLKRLDSSFHFPFSKFSLDQNFVTILCLKTQQHPKLEPIMYLQGIIDSYLLSVQIAKSNMKLLPKDPN